MVFELESVTGDLLYMLEEHYMGCLKSDKMRLIETPYNMNNNTVVYKPSSIFHI